MQISACFVMNRLYGGTMKFIALLSTVLWPQPTVLSFSRSGLVSYRIIPIVDEVTVTTLRKKIYTMLCCLMLNFLLRYTQFKMRYKTQPMQSGNIQNFAIANNKSVEVFMRHTTSTPNISQNKIYALDRHKEHNCERDDCSCPVQLILRGPGSRRLHQ